MVGNHWLPEGFGLTINFQSSLCEAILENFCLDLPSTYHHQSSAYPRTFTVPAVCDLLSWMAQELKARSWEPGSGEVGKCDW
jgi:hypothetical protein